MERLLSKFGDMIKTVQYIEHNLTEIIRLHHVLRLFDEKDIVPGDEYEEAEKAARELSEKFYNRSLGQVVNLIKEYHILSNSELEDLGTILDKRNYFVHHYFKDNDFEKHSDNYDFIFNQTNRLINFQITIDGFNNKLCELINELEEEYDLIDDAA
ncbi:hypothetical protein RI065_04330 [Mycoplasmatota bacterium zrk1]